MPELKDRPDLDAETGLQSDKAETRMTLRLSPEARETLEWIAEERKVSMAEAIRRALGTERFLIEKSNEGASILLEEKNAKRLKEIILR